MRMIKVALLAALMTAAVSTAHATEGYYGRLDLGISLDGEFTEDFFEDDEEDARQAQIGASRSFDLDDDWMASGGVGYAFRNGFRLEGELAYRNNEIEGTTVDAEAISAMANLFYDFNRGGGIEPYVGVGIGMGKLDIANDDDASMAFQAMAGVAIPLSERLDLDIGYRTFSMNDVQLFGVDAEYDHQAATVGLRWQFAAPAPPPQPQPQPQPAPQPRVVCPVSQFVVYFEWDRSNLNDAALSTIDAAIQRARECDTANVVIVGHTDTSGSTAYNVGLSERRAAMVREAIVARGVSASVVTTQARGETDLAQATRDGVREPLNRRTAVTITFR